jgi:hypothetical protein
VSRHGTDGRGDPDRPTWDLELKNVENGKTARRWIGGAFGWLRKSVSASSPKWAVLAGLLHCSASQDRGSGYGQGEYRGEDGANGSLTPEHRPRLHS